MTSRKTQARHKKQPSLPQAHPLQQVQASDYESETLYDPLPLPTRTNTELNLAVLQRYVPSITDILSFASSTEVYTYSLTAQAWERAEMSGTLFVCELDQGCGYCIVILNKKGLDNLIINMSDILDIDSPTEILIIRFKDKHVGQERALGFFMHDAPEGTRERTSMLIKSCWEKYTQENGGVPRQIEIFEDFVDEDTTGPRPGQRLSLSDLFGRPDEVR